MPNPFNSDPRTPIISMTSNTSPSDLMNYMASGMNDVLPKPFTKEGLLNMLDKHLVHLKTLDRMDQIPKRLGLPPLSKETLETALTAAASSSSMKPSSPTSPGEKSSGAAAAGASSSANDPGSLFNPLSGQGFTDDDFSTMLQSLLAAGAVSGEGTDAVSNAVGAQPRGASGSRSTPADASASSSAGKKRAAEDSPAVEDDADGSSTKKAKARFTELVA